MLVVPQKTIWTPWQSAKERWSRWLDKYTEGKLQRGSDGKIRRNSDGKLIRNSSTSSACCCDACTHYRVRRCCDDAYVNFAVAAADLPQLPFTFTYNDTSGQECWYVNSASQCTDAVTYPLITIPDDVTEYADCDACRVTCTECTSEDDCGCCSTCDALTPTEFTATFSGITVATTCSPNGCTCTAFTDGSAYGGMKVDSWSGGSFTLTQVSGSPCVFRVLGATGPTVRFYDVCGGTQMETDALVNVSLTCVGGIWRVVINHLFDGISSGAFLFVAEIGSDQLDCCGQNIIANDISSLGACPPCHLDFDPFAIGYGGQVVITPC